MTVRGLTALLCLLAFAGCNFASWRSIDRPGANQTIRVESGDRLFMDLEENTTTGYRWDCTCDDADVEVKIDHVAGRSGNGMVGVGGKAKVEIRIHRGYDGPSTVTFFYKRSWEKNAIKTFTISLFKRTGDAAFWK